MAHLEPLESPLFLLHRHEVAVGVLFAQVLAVRNEVVGVDERFLQDLRVGQVVLVVHRLSAERVHDVDETFHRCVTHVRIVNAIETDSHADFRRIRGDSGYLLELHRVALDHSTQLAGYRILHLLGEPVLAEQLDLELANWRIGAEPRLDDVEVDQIERATRDIQPEVCRLFQVATKLPCHLRRLKTVESLHLYFLRCHFTWLFA